MSNKVMSHNESDPTDEIKVLRKRLAEHELLHSEIKTEFDALKLMSEESNAKALMYCKLLEEERLERKKIETQALQMLKHVKNEYQKSVINETKAQFDDKIKTKEDLIKENDEEIKRRVNELTAQYKEEAAMAKLDLRITKRDLEQVNDQIKFLREQSRDLKKQLNDSIESNQKHKTILKSKDEEIERLLNQIKNIQNEINGKENDQKLVKNLMEDKIKSLESDAKALREQENDVSKWRAKYDECHKKNEQLLLTIQKLENKNKTLEIELNSKNNDCEQKEVSIKKLKNTNKVLQETCAQIERQAEQFRAKYEGLGEQKQRLLVDKNDTISEVHKLNKELEIIKNKLKSELKDKQEAYKQLESEQVEYENLIKAEKQKLLDLKQDFEKECQKTREYEEKISVQERNLYSSDETIRTLELTNNQLEEELIAIKEEAAKHITTIANLKESKQKLTIALEKSIQKAESLQDRIDKLHNEFDVKEEELNHERITTQETINQQLKLIDFLQNKIESLEKQKKPLFSLTPTKKIVNSPRYCPIEFKELDRALAEEKTKTRRLAEELSKSKSDANYYKREVLQLKKSIKDNQINFDDQTFRKPFDLCINDHNIINDKLNQSEAQIHFDKTATSFQRMHHNIPHRFIEVSHPFNAKCVSCAETIHFGRKALKCSECNAISHPKCVDLLPNNCGLPVELMQHLFHSSQDVNDNYFDDMINNEEQDVVEVEHLEPSAPEAHSPINYCNSSDSSATTDNNESDSGAFMSQALGTPVNKDIREIETICDNDNEECFSFTDSMLEVLGNEQK